MIDVRVQAADFEPGRQLARLGDLRKAALASFIGRVEAEAKVADLPAVIPSITGSAIATGFNTIWIDTDDPFHAGFSVT